jgi:hypothetical protein
MLLKLRAWLKWWSTCLASTRHCVQIPLLSKNKIKRKKILQSCQAEKACTNMDPHLSTDGQRRKKSLEFTNSKWSTLFIPNNCLLNFTLSASKYPTVLAYKSF